MGTLQNHLADAILTSTHNVCYGSKIRKIAYPCIPQFYYIKVGYNGVYISWTCFPDGSEVQNPLEPGCGFEQDAFEPCHEKNGFLPMGKQKAQISCAVTEQLISGFSAFVFATLIVQFIFYV